jgi:hypothetical protein
MDVLPQWYLFGIQDNLSKEPEHVLDGSHRADAGISIRSRWSQMAPQKYCLNDA